MNIFYLHHVPAVAAKMHCDKHVLKMILETAQLLSTAHRVLNPTGDHSNKYKKTHVNHPSAIWTRESASNYCWAHTLLRALLIEYTQRWGKEHATTRMVEPLQFPPIGMNLLIDWREPPQCMPDKYKAGDTVQAYRNYYIGEKSHFAKWKNGAPSWWPTDK